ncbi:MAG: NAD(P)H-dependent oxidoreductase [Peptococcaceae bacterium]|nr:NAD(P)H-dependent oxidoreductase [Peptococcaceae bacterium]
MKILAVNGSPHGAAGNTERILEPFLAGAGEAGARTETVYLKDKRIEHCKGCFTCWTKTPGVCVHKDDMGELLARIRETDVLVFATPLYVFTVSGLMKDFMDRIIPLASPYILKRGDQYIHPPRYPGERKGLQGRIVLIANCGYPERHHFGGLVETFRLFTSGPDFELAAVILCAAGPLLGVAQAKDGVGWYAAAARAAGRELVQTGAVAPETQALLDRDLIDPETYAGLVNARFADRSAPAAGPVAPELSPALSQPDAGAGLPQTFFEAVTGMAAAFNPAAAEKLRADIQFIVSGQEPGDYVLRIADGECTAHRGRVENPKLTVKAPAEVWLQIARNELSGQAAFLKGLFRTEGDFGLLLRLDELFARRG